MLSPTTSRPALSDRLSVAPTGLIRLSVSTGQHYPVTGLKTYGPPPTNSFIHFSTDLLPVAVAPEPDLAAEAAHAEHHAGLGLLALSLVLALTFLLTAYL